MEIRDGYRMALAHCGCPKCLAELRQLNHETANAEAVLGGDAIMITRVEPVVRDGKVGMGKKGAIHLDHRGTGRTYPHRKPRYNS